MNDVKSIANKIIKINKPIPKELKAVVEGKREWKNQVKSGNIRTSNDKAVRFL